GGMYSSPDAVIDINGAKVQLGPDGKPRRIDAASLKASGDFTAPGKSGHATVTTGQVTIVIGQDGSLQTVTGTAIQASGELDSARQAPAANPAPTSNAPPASGGQKGPTVAQEAQAAAGLVKSAEIHTSTPLLPGRYGKGFIHANVEAGSVVRIDLSVRNNA